MGACSSDIGPPPQSPKDFEFEMKDPADKPSNGFEWADWFGLKKEMALTKLQAEGVWGSVGDVDNPSLGKPRLEDLYSNFVDTLVESHVETEAEAIAMKKVRYTAKYERRLSLKVQGGAKLRGEPKFEEKLASLKTELKAELLIPSCRTRFFRAAKSVEDISKTEFVATAMAGGSLDGHEKMNWHRFNRIPDDIPPLEPKKPEVIPEEAVEGEEDFLRNRSKSFMAAARGFPTVPLAECPNLVTDWAIGQRTGPCPDCNNPRHLHPRGPDAPADQAEASGEI